MTELEPLALTADELAGRMLVLEAMAMVALGGAIRPITEATTPDQFIRVLNGVKRAVQIRIHQEQESGALSESGGAEAKASFRSERRATRGNDCGLGLERQRRIPSLHKNLESPPHRKKLFSPRNPLTLLKIAKKIFGKAWRKQPLFWKSLAKKLGTTKRFC